MARIRTIKPEFPQSESMGRVSRDARLLFVQLWTLCDDEGRTRAASRMLASLLFPYDDDAPSLIDGWLEELENEGCIVRYKADGATYLQVCNWLIHQKIDKPSQSKIPEFDESSRILANPRERSSLDQGSRIKDQGEDQGEREARSVAKPPRSPFGSRIPDGFPASAEIEWCTQERPELHAETVAARFRDHWLAKPGKDGRKLDWPATWRNWVRGERALARASPSPSLPQRSRHSATIAALTGRTETQDAIDVESRTVATVAARIG